MNFNQDLVSVTLGWLSFSVKVFLFKGCPGRVCVSLTFAFWTHTGSETTGRTHIPLPPTPASVPHGGAVILQPQSSHAIAGATRQEGPPLNASQPSRSPGQAKAPTHRSRAGSPGLRISAGERRARLPTPTPPTFWAHTRAHTPARARRHTRAYAHRVGPGIAVSAAARSGPGRSAGSPSRAPPAAPPRPAPRTRRAERAWGCKLLPSVRQGGAQAWARLGSAWLRIAVTAGLTVRPGVRPAQPRAPRGSRHPEPPPACAVNVPSCRRVCSQPPVRPRSPFSSSPAALAPSPPHPSWLVAPLGPACDPGPNSCLFCRSCCCCCCSGTRTAATRPPLGLPRPRPPTALQGTRTPSGLQETWSLLRTQAPRTWSLSTCSGFMRNTAEGARGREGATRSAVSVPGWVSRGDPPLPFSSPPRSSSLVHPLTSLHLCISSSFYSLTSSFILSLTMPPSPSAPLRAPSTLCQALSLQWERQSDTE